VLAGERSVVGLDGSVGRNLIEIENFFDWLTATEIHLLGYHGAVSLCKLGSCLGSCTLELAYPGADHGDPAAVRPARFPRGRDHGDTAV
jgi:hypothetical protein